MLITKDEHGLTICRKLDSELAPLRRDRNIISDFYDGKEPMSKDQQAQLGLESNTNYLTGRDAVESIVNQLKAVYTKPVDTWRIRLKKVPDDLLHKKHTIERKLTRAFNDAIKESNRIAESYKNMCGDVGLHGPGVIMWESEYDWAFEYVDLNDFLLPQGYGTDPEEWPYWGVKGELEYSDLKRIVDFHDDEDDEVETNWDLKSLRMLIKLLESDDASIAGSDFGHPGMIEFKEGKEQYIKDSTISVYYFYQPSEKDDDGNVNIQRLIFLESALVVKQDGGQKPGELPMILYSNDEFAGSAGECIKVFNIATNLSKGDEFHKIIGTGALNLAADSSVESSLNRAMQSFDERMTTFWIANEHLVDIEEAEDMIIRRNSVIPEGIRPAEQAVGMRWQEALGMINYMSNISKRRASKVSGQGGTGNRDQLEIQAEAEISEIQNSKSDRMSKFIRQLQSVGRFMAQRMLEDQTEHFPGYKESKEFKDAIKDLDVPKSLVTIENMKFSVNRLPGDDDQQAKGAIYRHLSSTFERFDPRVQPMVHKMMTEIATDDYDLAEAFHPIEDKIDFSQDREALQENTVCLTQFLPPPISVGDIDEVHAANHLSGMERVILWIQENQQMLPEHEAGLRALGQHTQQHIERISTNKSKTNLSRELQARLKQYGEVFEQLMAQFPVQNVNNQQQQVAQQLDIAKLQLQQVEMERKLKKDQDANFKFGAQQSFREWQAQINAQIQAGHLNVQQQLANLKAVESELKATRNLIEASQNGTDNSA